MMARGLAVVLILGFALSLPLIAAAQDDPFGSLNRPGTGTGTGGTGTGTGTGRY